MAGFSGDVSVIWLSHAGADRDMKLNQNFTFTDKKGVTWTAKKGAVINGASIPSIFWSTFGSPFIGDYRRASVVHDYFCEVKTKPSDATHTMFYEACIEGGVSQARAKTMYFMVKTFGPSWKTALNNLELSGEVAVQKGKKINFTHTMAPEDIAELTKWIETKNPTLKQIDAKIAQKSAPVAIVPLNQAEIG